MTDTLKRPGQEPKRESRGTTVHVAEYDRASLRLLHSWPIGEYPLRADAARARGIVAALLDARSPDPAHEGTRELTEEDLGALRRGVAAALPTATE